MRKTPILALVAALWFPLHSQAFVPSAAGNTATYGGFTATPSNIGQYVVSTASDGRVLISQPVRMQVPGGGTIPLNVTGSIPRASAASAIGRFAGKSLSVVGPLAVGAALFDLGRELNFILSNGSGSTVVQAGDPSACTSSPCFRYRINQQTAPVVLTPWGTPSESGASFSAAMQQATKTTCGEPGFSPSMAAATFSFEAFTPPASISIRRTTQACTASGQPSGSATVSFFSPPVQREEVPPSSGVTVVPLQSFADAIASTSGWPTTSSLAPATVAAIRSGESLSVESPVVTGPATSPGPVTVTNTGPAGETTTSTTTHNHTYAGPNVTTTTTTTIVTINNQTGAETGRQTITETPVIPAPAPSAPAEPAPFEMPCGVAGGPPCAVKVDESAVPAGPGNILSDQDSGMPGIRPLFDAAIDQAESVEAPEWTWTFALPTGCSPLPMGAFNFEIDICEFQPVIHDLMSMVWLAAGIFGLLALLRSAMIGQ